MKITAAPINATNTGGNMEFFVTLKRPVRYPAAWTSGSPRYAAGTVVPVIVASNQPDYKSQGLVWVNTPELKDDAYGILLGTDDYERVQ